MRGPCPEFQRGSKARTWLHHWRFDSSWNAQDSRGSRSEGNGLGHSESRGLQRFSIMEKSTNGAMFETRQELPCDGARACYVFTRDCSTIPAMNRTREGAPMQRPNPSMSEPVTFRPVLERTGLKRELTCEGRTPGMSSVMIIRKILERIRLQKSSHAVEKAGLLARVIPRACSL